MLDDVNQLRNSTNDDDFFGLEDEEEFVEVQSESDMLFLGMTPVERMFLSIFLFMNVTVLGLALLLATGRIG